jgi:hypothetical protein
LEEKTVRDPCKANRCRDFVLVTFRERIKVHYSGDVRI